MGSAYDNEWLKVKEGGAEGRRGAWGMQPMQPTTFEHVPIFLLDAIRPYLKASHHCYKGKPSVST